MPPRPLDGVTHQGTLALADHNGALEVQVITIGEFEGVEVGVEHLDARSAIGPFQNIGKNGSVHSASVHIQKILL